MNNVQHGPPGSADVLEDLVRRIVYKDKWKFRLGEMDRPTEHLAGGSGLTLGIMADVPDSQRSGKRTLVDHWFAVPPAAYDTATWLRWIFDCIAQVELHEAMEFFRLPMSFQNDVGEPENNTACIAPFFPNHGPLTDPYLVEYKL